LRPRSLTGLIPVHPRLDRRRLGYEVQIFFTFYGLKLLEKKLSLEVTPLGNPGMPMPMAMDKWFPVLLTALPGMQA